MITAVVDQLQDRLQDGSCLLISGPQTTAASALTAAPQTAAATAKTVLTAGSTTLKTGAGVGTAAAALSAGAIVGTIFGIMVIGAIAYGANVMVRAYID